MSDLVTEFWPVQPEPGSVADQLIKKGEARGISLGEARGEARGIELGEKRATIKMISRLQSILGISESSDEEFSDKRVSDLEMIIETLQTKVSNRPTKYTGIWAIPATLRRQL